jgi:type I restriction enzyme S subunit
MVRGWVEKPLLDCVDLLQGLTYAPGNVKDYGLLVLRSSNIKNGKLAFDDCVFVDCVVDGNKYVQPNDILICVRNGSNSLIGKSCVVDRPYNATFGAFMAVLRGDGTGYVAHIFTSDIIQRQIRDRSNATINQITKRDFENIVIPIPTDAKEQRAIAAALSDADAYIAALEKLIGKKRLVKQGAVQELLTGKRRLPGFSGEWVEFNLAENSTLKARIGWQGLTTAEYLEAGYAYLITGTDFSSGKIAWSGCHYVEKNRYDQDPYIQVLNGDVLITKDGTIGKVAIVKDLTRKATLNSGVFVVRLKSDKYVSEYLYYILLSEIFAGFLAKLAAGSTINHLYQKDFVNFEFMMPPTKDEQTVIAEILSDMDAEIDALAAKLTKARYIKQGMMSELLTGNIRLAAQDALVEAATELAPEVAAPAKPAPKGHNQQFDDAVAFAVIVDKFSGQGYPLGRVRTYKTLYLLRRYQEQEMVGYAKKAAGPYKSDARYAGGEKIAQSSGYIVETKGKQGFTLSNGKNMAAALKYSAEWGWQDAVAWLENLRYKKTDELELLATVDMAIRDLENDGKPATLGSIKDLIANDKEWKAKLAKPIFSDANITRAICELQALLPRRKS